MTEQDFIVIENEVSPESTQFSASSSVSFKKALDFETKVESAVLIDYEEFKKKYFYELHFRVSTQDRDLSYTEISEKYIKSIAEVEGEFKANNLEIKI